MTSDRKRGLAGIILVFLFIIGDVITGLGASHVTPTQVLTHVEKSFFTCTVTINTDSCSVAKTFATAFTSKPSIVENWNGTPPNALFAKAFSQAPEEFVFQAVTSTTWTNMPVALTELYGGSSLRIDWSTTLTFTQQNWKFCANLVTTSAGAAPILFTQYSTDGGTTWTTMGDANFPVNILLGPGFVCGSAESIILPQNAILRVVGSGGNGVGDNPAFGLLELELTSGIFSISVPTPCAPTYSLLATTSVTLTIKCNQAVLAAVTGTVDWRAELT